jgi:hypothetical protein
VMYAPAARPSVEHRPERPGPVRLVTNMVWSAHETYIGSCAPEDPDRQPR